MTTCELILDWFDDYYDGTLEEANRLTFEAHLASCESCKAMVADLTLMREVMLDMPLVSLPQDFNETLHEKLVAASEEIKQDLNNKKKTKILPFRMKQAGPLVGLAAAIMIIATGTAQLGKVVWWMPNQNEMAYDTAMTDAATAPESSANQVVAAPPQEKMAVQFEASTAGSGAENAKANYQFNPSTNATDAGVNKNIDNRRELVRTGQVNMTVGDLEAFTVSIQSLIDSVGGYIENSYTDSSENVQKNQDLGNQMNSNFVLRVPASEFTALFEGIKKLGRLESSQQNVIDVTNVVVDLEASLENLKTRETTLKTLMGTAKNVEEVMTVEKELSSTRLQIDQLSAQLKAQKSQVSYSTLYINVTQSPDVDNRLSGVDKNVFGMAYQGLIKNINLLTQWIEVAFIWVVSWSPAILAFILAGFGLTKTKTYRKWRKK